MDAYIVDFARSPYQFARKGKFAGLRPDDLAAQVVRALVARQPFEPELIEDIGEATHHTELPARLGSSALTCRRAVRNVPACSIAGGMSSASTRSAWTSSVIRRSTPVAARKLDPVRRAAKTNAVGIATRTRLRATRATSKPSQPKFPE